ncbi:predicted protein [Nematostella vectensis]|uniref:Activating signal cointegrator 1 n=2 Tax=Nematostella vectensis TaxID=45351 RepID=A7RPW2_NEMVE|nr:predicted protein [Nematostella vectensis]|eukprot:XP_001638454.1 predicted protein [Nematostella vectensis]
MWCVDELSKITDCGEEITDYILHMDNIEDVKEYLGGFLGQENPKQIEFLNILVQRLNEINPEFERAGTWVRKEKLEKETSPTKGNSKADKKIVEQEKKKSTKFVPLYSKEGEARSSVRLPGRHPCECLGQKHGLVNNCTSCGRIVCDQEGAGPCYFCGALVCSRAEQEIIARESKKSAKLLKQLMSQEFSEEVKSQGRMGTSNGKDLQGLDKAIAHKNKLLEYDKTSVCRTKVIDDECDYFSTDGNKWLSKKEKEQLTVKEEELRAKRHGSRRDMKITLDFAGRRVVEENSTFDMYGQDPDLPVLASGYYSTQSNKENVSIGNEQAFPELNLKFISSGGKQAKSKVLKTENNIRKLRVQDRELQEMSDAGLCLSMHQPWASLLVLGIKRVEGRSWYTAHRGRLWIAATAKKPSADEISGVIGMYREMNPDSGVHFPKEYPTGCLLGCVDLEDCLSQEEYRERCQDSDHTESSSPFVFICENPQQLVLKFPVKGQHKIWKLESGMHKAAKQGIARV